MQTAHRLIAAAAASAIAAPALAQSIPAVTGQRDVCIEGCRASFPVGTPAFEDCIAACQIGFVGDLVSVFDQIQANRPPLPWWFRPDVPWANAAPGISADPTPTPMIPFDPNSAIIGLGALDLVGLDLNAVSFDNLFGQDAVQRLNQLPVVQTQWLAVRAEVMDFNGNVSDLPDDDVSVDDFGQFYRFDLTTAANAFPAGQPLVIVAEIESPDFADDIANPTGVLKIAAVLLPTPSANADLVSPIGQLTFADISAFINAFSNGGGAADLADPFGQFTFADISAFINAFTAN